MFTLADRRIPSVVAAMLLTSGLTWGQNLLDNNLQVGSRGRNAAAQQNVYGQYSNAIVTGNVPGLNRFRGSLDYRSQREFRGALPSRGIFDFEARSYRLSDDPTGGTALSSNPLLQSPNARGSRSGQIFGSSPFSGQILDTPGAGVSVGQLTGFETSYNPAPGSGGRLPRIQAGVVGEALDARYTGPETEGTFGESGQLLRVNPTPLSGLSLESGASSTTPETATSRFATQGWRGLEATRFDRKPAGLVDAKPTEGTGATSPTPNPNALGGLNTRVAPLGATSRLGSGQLTGELAAKPLASGEQLRFRSDVGAADEPIAALIAGQPGSATAKPGEDIYLDLLHGINRQAMARAERAPNQLIKPLQPDGQQPGETDQGQATLPDPQGQPAAPSNVFDPSTIRKLNYDLPPLRTMAGNTGSTYDRLLGRAEQAMQQGKYFDAESFYRTAQSVRPNHPLAAIGRVNAQLGAGVYVTAGKLLSDLFERHPEIVSARYTQPLLPDAERLERANTQLDKAIAAEASPDLLLLSAYLNRQLGEPEKVSAQLDRLEQQGEKGSLVRLLKKLWLDDEEANEQRRRDRRSDDATETDEESEDGQRADDVDQD